MRRWSLALAALLTGLLVTGRADAQDKAASMGSMTMPGMTQATPDTSASRAYAKANADMMQGMSVKMSGDPDRDFVTMMIAHHEGAIDMAKVELDHGHDPILRKLAENVISAQTSEIKEMKAWQQRHPR
ncbi:protein of unknown function [Arboricoccus pini]|uniref:DUF305 domain-containing protein n=1 Tax=Arboricoccus pini TaxID=1963835 RepID=A0A212RD41_9PROT|nr:DUF305 domain-containing protein [Arboricoccus pini]SNB70158.1 protein of unknown function [Arboricoccus pini]